MHAGRRRTLPPVPRAGGERGAVQPIASPAEDDASPAEVPTQRFVVDFSTGEQPSVPPAHAGPRNERDPGLDETQVFVERLRSAAPDFAEAAGAASAVVREAVPPARHRRARCRVVLRYADDTEADLMFLGPAGSPGTQTRHGFDRQIKRWFGAGQHREAAWLVADEDASDGVAVDVSAWAAAG